MKSVFIVLIAIVSLNAQAGRNQNREVRQENRINRGAESGELTRHESQRLERGQNKIDRYQQKAVADGELSAKEKIKLERMQDRQSRKIYIQKHDHQQGANVENE